MPSDVSGNYSLPAGYLAVAGTTILTTQHNPIFQDVAQGLTDRIMANGAKAMTAELTLSGNPATALGAAPKQYVDSAAAAAIAAMNIKQSVVCATTANITLSAEQTIDGVTTASSRVLVKNQTAPAENGIYLTGSGAWSRVTDMDAWTEVYGAFVAVETGTIWKDTMWLCTADSGGTINTTAVTWRRFDTNFLRNAQTGTTYTIVTDDHNRHITTSNAGAIATTLPQATTNFGFGFSFIIENLGAGANTITPTTSTINGGATLILRTGDCYKITSDGTNYRALPHGITYAQLTGLTEDTTPDATADFVVMSDISATLLKKVKIQNLAGVGTSSKTAGYTVVAADRGTSIRFAGLSADATVALPAAATCGNGFILYLSNEDTTDTAPFGMIVDPNGAELIDGFSTRKGFVGTRICILCDGTGWRTVSGYWRYFSGDQTITSAGSLTLAHGLGVRPRRFWVELKNSTAEGNYSVGDIVAVAPTEFFGANQGGASIVPDATNLNIRYASAGNVWDVPNKTTGAALSITNASWRARFYAED